MKSIKNIIFIFKKKWLSLQAHDLWNAAKSGDVETVKKFIDAGFDVNSQDNSGNTLLHYACYKQNWLLIDFLLDKKTSSDIKNNNQKTAFLTTCNFCSLKVLEEKDPILNNEVKEKSYQIVKKMIFQGTDVNTYDMNQNTSFIHACINNHLPIVKLLLKNKVDFYKRNNDDYDGLMYAISKEHHQIVETIFNHCLDKAHLYYCRQAVEKIINQNELRDNQYIKILDTLYNYHHLDSLVTPKNHNNQKIKKI